MPESYVTNQTEKGNISISEDVITVMVNAAVSEIEGVAGLTNPTSSDIAELLGVIIPLRQDDLRRKDPVHQGRPYGAVAP